MHINSKCLTSLRSLIINRSCFTVLILLPYQLLSVQYCIFFRTRVENSVLSLAREPVPSLVVVFSKRRWRRWTFSIFTVSTEPSQRGPLKYGVDTFCYIYTYHIILYHVRVLRLRNIVLLPLLPTILYYILLYSAQTV